MTFTVICRTRLNFIYYSKVKLSHASFITENIWLPELIWHVLPISVVEFEWKINRNWKKGWLFGSKSFKKWWNSSMICSMSMYLKFHHSAKFCAHNMSLWKLKPKNFIPGPSPACDFCAGDELFTWYKNRLIYCNINERFVDKKL